MHKNRNEQPFKVGRPTGLGVVLVGLLWMGILALPWSSAVQTSMDLDLKSGQIVLYWPWGSLRAGDYGILQVEGRLLVRKVAAVPGDTLFLDRDGQIVVASFEQTTRNTGALYPNPEHHFPWVLEEDTYFVLDDALEYLDSRTSLLGGISASQFKGKLVLRLWPLTFY